MSSEAFCLYELVRLHRAEEVVVRFEDVAAGAQGELIATMAAHARAVVDNDPARLAAVADRFVAMSLHLYASEAAAQASTSAQRLGDQRGAARHMQRAAERRALCDSVVSWVPVVDVGPVSFDPPRARDRPAGRTRVCPAGRSASVCTSRGAPPRTTSPGCTTSTGSAPVPSCHGGSTAASPRSPPDGISVPI